MALPPQINYYNIIIFPLTMRTNIDQTMGRGVWVIGWLAKNYDDAWRKNVNLKRKWWKTGERGKFSLYLGEKYHFGKRGGGKNIFLGEIYTPGTRPTPPPLHISICSLFLSITYTWHMTWFISYIHLFL